MNDHVKKVIQKVKDKNDEAYNAILQSIVITPLSETQVITKLADDALALFYSNTGKLNLTAKEKKALIKIFPDEQIEIRPDGYIYLPQVHYRIRLNEVIGPGDWGLVIKGSYIDGNKLFVVGLMVIRNCYVSESTGEAASTYENQSKATVWESAKSDCMTRCCKDLGIGSQVYDPTYIKYWQKQFATVVWCYFEKEKKSKRLWRKITADPFYNEIGSAENNAPVPDIPAQFKQKDPNGNYNNNQNGEIAKPWLNKTHRQTGAITKEWLATVHAIESGDQTVEDVEENFRINYDNKKELQSIRVDMSEVQKLDPKWITMLTKCRFKEDVSNLSLKHQAEIEMNPALRILFLNIMKNLPKDQIR